MSVKSSTSVTKVVSEIIIGLYSVAIVWLAYKQFPVGVLKTAVQLQVLAISALLGISIWKVIQDTSQLDPGQFKEIYIPDYVVSFICFGIVFLPCSKDAQTYETVLSWLIGGIGVICVAIVVALKGNSIATGDAEDSSK